MKRTIRLPRSDEGGMLLDMPHAAYLGVHGPRLNQLPVLAFPLSQLARLALITDLMWSRITVSTRIICRRSSRLGPAGHCCWFTARAIWLILRPIAPTSATDPL
jgi:hypothetical protein